MLSLDRLKDCVLRSARTSRTVSVRPQVGPSVELNEDTNNTCIPATVLYSIALYSAAWYGTAQCGAVPCCVVRYGTARYSTRLLEHAM